MNNDRSNLTREAITSLDEPIRQMVEHCRAMPRGKARSDTELELGKLLKKQDAMIFEMNDLTSGEAAQREG